MAIRLSSSPIEQLRVMQAPPGKAEQECEPISSWEIPFDHELGTFVDPGPGPTGYVPFGWGSIPQAAVETLTELIAVDRPRDVLVAPAGVRQIKGSDIYCPTKVLAAGEHGVALWVDALPRRILSCNAYGCNKWSPWARQGLGGWRTAALTDRELVVWRNPTSRWERRAGKDSLAILRRHLRQLTATGPSLCIDAGATHNFTVGAAFARRTAKELAPIPVGSPALTHPLETQRVQSMSDFDLTHDRYNEPVKHHGRAQ